MLRVTVNTHHHKRLIHLSFICAFMALFAGCITVGPDYKQPTISLAPAWNSQLKSGLITEEIDSKTLGTWWTTINDPELSGLIDRAVTGNHHPKRHIKFITQPACAEQESRDNAHGFLRVVAAMSQAVSRRRH